MGPGRAEYVRDNQITLKAMTQQAIILALLRDNGGWVNERTLIGRETEYGFLGSESKKRCRELRAKGLIEVEYRGPHREAHIRIKRNEMGKKEMILSL